MLLEITKQQADELVQDKKEVITRYFYETEAVKKHKRKNMGQRMMTNPVLVLSIAKPLAGSLSKRPAQVYETARAVLKSSGPSLQRKDLCSKIALKACLTDAQIQPALTILIRDGYINIIKAA